MKVALAQFPGGGVSRMETNAWVVDTVRKMRADPRIEGVVSLTYNDTPITMCRNKAVVEARQAGCEYALFVDSDMYPDYAGPKPFWDTAWEFMMDRYSKMHARAMELRVPLKDEVSITFGPTHRHKASAEFRPATIAAPYCGPSPHQCVFVFEWAQLASGKPDPGFRLEMIPREAAAIRTGIQEVAALPTGLILYDMRVFDVLPSPWFDYEWADPERTRKASTEDVYQTRNASLLGCPQYVAWDCWAGHVKTEVVGKPTVIRADQVHQSLRQAVLRGVNSDEGLMILPDHAEDDDGRI